MVLCIFPKCLIIVFESFCTQTNFLFQSSNFSLDIFSNFCAHVIGHLTFSLDHASAMQDNYLMELLSIFPSHSRVPLLSVHIAVFQHHDLTTEFYQKLSSHHCWLIFLYIFTVSKLYYFLQTCTLHTCLETLCAGLLQCESPVQYFKFKCWFSHLNDLPIFPVAFIHAVLPTVAINHS